MASDKPKNSFNARVLSTRRASDLKAELEKSGAEWAGIERMARKVVHHVIKLHGVRTPAALILKEEMLSKGGDCAIHRDAIVNKVERCDCVLMGTRKAFETLTSDLRLQGFGLSRMADEIEQAIAAFESAAPRVPPADQLPAPLKPFYEAMAKRTLVMGILNVTTDSFSDGGLYANMDAAIEHAESMADDGADVIDIGGESTRPGAEPVSADDEISRVVPVVRALVERLEIPVSVDTSKVQVARAALDAGASIINDVTGFADPEMRALSAERKAPAVVMHMKGTPRTMQEAPAYDDLIGEVMLFLRERAGLLIEAGLPAEYIITDPGIGFGKTAEHNMEIIRNLADFKSLGFPILIGTSRKAFIGKALGDVPTGDRLEGTAATVALSIANGASIVRVHDVKPMVRVARMADAITRG